MGKRKYTRFGEKSVAFSCTNVKCKWEGLDEEKEFRKEADGWNTHICPDCGNEEFYGLLELPTRLK